VVTSKPYLPYNKVIVPGYFILSNDIIFTPDGIRKNPKEFQRILRNSKEFE